MLVRAGSSSAQDNFPSKPVQIVVATAAGGAADLIGRTLSDRLSEQMQQPMVVINQAGANGGLAATQVARAAPDGYTLLLAIDTNLLVNPLLYTNLSYDPFRDFAPISRIARVVMTMAVPPSGPSTLQEFIAKAKANPGKLNYGSVGVGSTHHLGTERFKILTNIDITHIPYKGTAPANTDLLAGVIDMIFAGVGVANPLLQAGKIKVLAIAAEERSPLMPDVPTMAEAGVPGYEQNAWFAMLAPAKTPTAIVERLAREIKIAVADPRFRDRLKQQGMDILGTSPAEMAAQMRSDTDKWKQVIDKLGLKLSE